MKLMRNNKLPSYNDDMIRIFGLEGGKTREVTFQITSQCNLRCSYCYERHKGAEVMSLATGKKIVDLLLKMWEDDKPEMPITKQTKGIVLDFIGGEPLLEVDLIDGILSYFMYKCEELNCPLSRYLRVSISTNGVNFFEDKVQRFVRKYSRFLSLSVSVDGPKHLHDSCRVDAAGNGSFDKAIMAYRAAGKLTGIWATKMTFVPETLPYLAESVKFMLDQNPTFVACNYAYEPVYTWRDASVLYEQLKLIANHLIAEKRDICVSILDDACGKPQNPAEDKNYCGGTGDMLSFDPQGVAYPCLRYHPISIGREKAREIAIGDLTGVFNTPHTVKIKDYLDGITLTSQSPDECIHCSVASGCGWCSAYNYDCTGDVNHRLTNICKVHKARSLACSYYYNARYLAHGDVLPTPVFLPRDDALNFVSLSEWVNVKELERRALAHVATAHPGECLYTERR